MARERKWVLTKVENKEKAMADTMRWRYGETNPSRLVSTTEQQVNKRDGREHKDRLVGPHV